MSAYREARARLRESHRLNIGTMQPEFAYSPKTGAVGMRWVDGDPIGPFRVFNIHYPMYGRSDEVADWVSVGMAIPKGGRP